MANQNDVLISGLGLVTPLGLGVKEPWENLLQGQTKIQKIQNMDVETLPIKIGSELPADFEEATRPYFRKRSDYKKTLRFGQIAVAGASMALEDAGIDVSTEDATRIGVCQGSGMGALLYTEHQTLFYYKDERLDPLSIVKVMPNVASSAITINLGIRGPSLTLTTACASGAHAIGVAYDWIKSGKVDFAIAGGVEVPFSPLSIISFNFLGALSKREDHPEQASRPFDKDRDGFVFGEGGGTLILESRKHLEARGGDAYCELKGWSCSSEAHNLAMPMQTGEGMAETMTQALRDAQVDAEQMDYINAHGTSTKFNDVCETKAIKQVFGDHAYQLSVNSIKSMLGHCIGAGGAIEMASTALSLKHQVIPPTINLEEPDPECDLDYTANQKVEKPLEYAMSNSFAFGGNNCCIVAKKI